MRSAILVMLASHTALDLNPSTLFKVALCGPQENQTRRMFQHLDVNVLVDLYVHHGPPTNTVQMTSHNPLEQTASASLQTSLCLDSGHLMHDGLDFMKGPPAVEDGFPWPVMPCPIENCAAQI